VKQDEAALLGRGGDQEVGDLAAAETSRGKEPLDFARPLNVRGIRLDQRKRGKRREMPARAIWPAAVRGSSTARTAR
jgi:hypothetical protein